MDETFTPTASPVLVLRLLTNMKSLMILGLFVIFASTFACVIQIDVDADVPVTLAIDCDLLDGGIDDAGACTLIDE
jgi:hypothetical protein